MNKDTLLEINGISKSFGALRAVNNVSFNVEKGQIFSLIGPNGAGKTTLINLITGYYSSDNGKVNFNHKNITNLHEYEICQLKMVRTFQKIKIFREISVIDNVLIGTHCRSNSGVISGMLRTNEERKEELDLLQKSFSLLKYMGIEKLWENRAKALSYGDQRRLEIARALATSPLLLLLDEPVAGMNPVEKNQMVDLIYDMRNRGITIFLVEHDMNVVMEISDRIAVMNYGEKIAEGTPNEIKSNQMVIDAYLGKGFHDEFFED